MKIFFTHLWLTAICVATGITVSGSHLQPNLLFSARMNGDQEVPPVTTDATGVATFTLNSSRDTLCVTMSVQDLSGPITGAHIHEGLPDTTGGVLVDLVPYLNGNRLAATITGSTLTPDLIAKLLNGSLYINVHTDLNPNGEIRGQITLETDANYLARLNGESEVPPVATDALGLGIFTLSKDQTRLGVKVLVRDLSGPITGAHLHVGAPDSTGGVVADLTSFVSGNYIEAIVDPAPFINDLFAGKIYVNVHTTLNPDGEIRGQLHLNPNIAFDAKMDGTQEVPPVTTDALGLLSGRISYTFDTLWFYGVVRDLSGPVTAAHFHEGEAGVPGGVVIDISSSVNDTVLDGMITAPTLTTDFINDLLSGNIYVNLHTDANTDGEIRGQVYRFAREGYTFEIDGSQEVSPVVTNGSGFGMVSIDRDQSNAHFMLVFGGLSGPATGAHFHLGIPGENGGVLYDLTPFLEMTDSSDAAFGYWSSDDPNVPFTIANSIQFRSDSIYFNVHTVANPDGEIRGDVKRGSVCFDVGVGIENLNQESGTLEIFPNPVKNQLTLDINGVNQAVTEVRIYDLSGKLISTNMIQDSQTKLVVDVNDLSQGMYILSVKAGEQFIRKSFTKQ